MLYRQARKCRAWWDTEFSRQWQITGWFARNFGRLFAPCPPFIPDNDRDHVKW